MDKLTVFGFPGGIVLMLIGQYLEGGHATSLIGAAAFFIVFGGTAGAIAVSVPAHDLKFMKEGFLLAMRERKFDANQLISQLVEFATVARRQGILSLDQQLETISDDFMKKGLQLVVDGVDPQVARDSMETEIMTAFEEEMAGGKSWELGGGYAPTIGLIGAVMGLIHVMENLDDPDSIGPGIAVAFVATIYGIGIANLWFLPVGAKIKRKAGIERDRKTLIAEGLLAIQEGLNPKVLEEKLRAFAGKAVSVKE